MSGATRQKQRIGFVGLGVMGQPMARNLIAAGFPVTVWNRSPARSEDLGKEGAAIAEDLAGVCAEADLIITMLADDAAVSGVYSGEHGLIRAASPGTLLVEMSTISPDMARELAEAARERGLAILDAPVSGGDVGARDGTLSIMVGGAGDDVRRAGAVFEVLGSRTAHVGPPGAGQVTKACNQVVVAVTFAALSEALVLGSKLGVVPAAILEALAGGMAASRVIDVRRDNFLEHDFEPGFKVDLHHKDLTIALEAAAAGGVSLPLTALVQQMFQQLRAAGFGGEDDTALLRIAEAAAGHQIGTNEGIADATDRIG